MASCKCVVLGIYTRRCTQILTGNILPTQQMTVKPIAWIKSLIRLNDELKQIFKIKPET